MFNLKKKLSVIALTSIILLSSTGFVFADEAVNDIETVQVKENVERTSYKWRWMRYREGTVSTIIMKVEKP